MKTPNYKLLETFVRNNSNIQNQLGKLLYENTRKLMHLKLDEITEEKCISYILYLVTEKTIYGQLQQLLNTKIEPAPDKWDRLYNVDFFIKIGKKYIGL